MILLTNGLDEVWVAADTAAIAQTGDQRTRLPGAFNKLKAAHHGSHGAIVAIAGEAEFAGKGIFEHLAVVESDLFSDNGLDRIRDKIAADWLQDFDTYNWDSEAEKKDYAKQALLTILIIRSPQRFTLLHGTVEKLEIITYDPARYIVGFGVNKDVQRFLEEPEKPVEQWAEFLAKVFATAAAGDQAVGFPVDVAQSNPTRGFTITRCDSPEALRALKNT